MKTKAKELRELTVKDLYGKLMELKKEYFNLRFQQATGQLEKTSQLKEVRKSIARVLTVINEKKKKEVK
jgi:large subunit ribosomal protein L29